MTIEDRLIDTFATCRSAIRPSPALLERPVKGDPMYQRRNRVLVGLAAAAIIAVAAAVAASATSTNHAAAPTKQSFVGHADAICTAAKNQVFALPAYKTMHGGAPTAADARSYDAQVRTIDLQAIAQLQALAAPPADRAAVDAMVARLAVPLGATTVFTETIIASGDVLLNTPTGEAAAAANTREEVQAAKAARDFGVEQCASLPYG